MFIVQDIKDKVISFGRETKSNETEIVNKFLDDLLVIQELLNRQAVLFEMMSDYLSDFKQSFTTDTFEEIDTLLKPMVVDSIKTYARLKRNNKIYSGVKTAALEYRNRLDDLRETINDIKLIASLKEDDEYNALMERIIKKL